MGALPLRAAANSLKLTFLTLFELRNYIAPSFTTIKRWAQKVGYYKLTRPKAKATDWMVIIDASIQMGEQKCVLVLGCREIDLPKNRAPTLQDFEILALRIVSSMKANIITQILNEVAESVGKIVCVCSDRGSDMHRGIKDFQATNPEARHICDTAHRVSNLLECILEKNERWKKFREEVTLSRRRMQNSLVACALPPSPRTKARYMNVGSLIEWAAGMLLLLERGAWNNKIDINELKKHLGWLQEYREDIIYWNKLISIGAEARQVVRLEGIHMDIVEHFEKAISSIPMGLLELKFADQLALFLMEQSKRVKPGERFIGSTEVLESLFGKLKAMEQEQTSFGFTSLVLATMACVGPIDKKTVRDAIRIVKLSDIEDWSQKELGKSIQSQRRSIRILIKSLKKKMTPKVSGILEEEAVAF